MERRFAAIAGITCVGWLVSISPVFGGLYLLNQSNTFADGINYGSVEIDVTLNGNNSSVKFTVEAFTPTDNPALLPLYVGIDANSWGLASFGFNYENVSAFVANDPRVSLLPTGWSIGLNTNQDGFGQFELVASESGAANRADPLVFTINNLTAAEAVESNFYVLSSGNAGQGNQQFAAHVAGFTGSTYDENYKLITSQYIGGGPPGGGGGGGGAVPEPATLAIWSLLGTIALGCGRLRRRRQAV